MTPEERRARDASDLRWFWCESESLLGFAGSGDFERAAQAPTARTPRCPRCSVESGPGLAKFDAAGRRARRAKCRECLGLGVVVPSTYPSGNPPASPCEESPWMGMMRRGNEPILSAREPAWMGLVGPASVARRRHRTVRIALMGMDAGHVRVLHAVHGPAPRPPFPTDMPEAAAILAAMNRSLPEQERTRLLGRLRSGNRDRFTMSAARRHVDMLLAGSWRAYDRARGRHTDEESGAVDQVLAEADRVLDASAELLRLVTEERGSGVLPVVAASVEPERKAE